jgi:hypothetical protein
MISIKGGQLSRNPRKKRRNKIWNRGRRELSHHYLEIILRNNRLIENPKIIR